MNNLGKIKTLYFYINKTRRTTKIAVSHPISQGCEEWQPSWYSGLTLAAVLQLRPESGHSLVGLHWSVKRKAKRSGLVGLRVQPVDMQTGPTGREQADSRCRQRRWDGGSLEQRSDCPDEESLGDWLPLGH